MMSDAVLMSASWQPTVLQLMPFSSNNASHRQSLVSFPDDNCTFARGFPTLAVTRSSRQDVKPVRVSSERLSRSEALRDNGPPTLQRARSEYCSRVKGALVTEDETHLANTVSRTINRSPELTDSTDSSERMYSGDVPLRNNKLLPKPSPCMPYDGRYFLPQNGFWRSITMTPGEMELQKHRDSFGKEPKKKHKKQFKLNVNQLPRSTTPIHDNDPDKLNMKQVIRFLQTREGDAPERIPKSPKQERRVKSSYPSSTPSKLADRLSTDPDSVHKSPIRREITSVSFGSNTFSSPIIKKRVHKQTLDETRYADSINPSSFKTTREFRLHRFLTMTSSFENVASDTYLSKKVHPITSAQRRLIITDGSKFVSSEPDVRKTTGPVLHYSQSRHADKYARLQYRLSNRRNGREGYTPEHYKSFGTQTNKVDMTKEGVIRLPSMLDFRCESENDEDDLLKAKMRVPDLKSETGSSECLSLEANACCSDSPTSLKDVLSDSDISVRLPSRKVTISLPRETNVTDTEIEKRTPDPVRLTMRQGSNLTRERTYMSDMVKRRDQFDYCPLFAFSTRVEHDSRFDVE